MSHRHESSEPDQPLRKDDLRQALALTDHTYSASGSAAAKISGLTPFGALIPFTDQERAQLTSLRELIERYVAERSPVRPLSLAVFGPPGSGKSFAVKQILAVIKDNVPDARVKLPYTGINLTQVPDSAALGRVLARIAGEQDGETVPIVFFDEFDAPRATAAYGWLAWFLAPMQDGEFLHEGAVVRLKRAVYVFAGGTAATMDKFSHLDAIPQFHSAKGPDFVSRLRGFLDVKGPNSAPRMLRRAVLLRNELAQRARRNGEGSFTVERELLISLLGVGRYRHGARSIAAIIELSDLGGHKTRFGWRDLPEDHIVSLHIDRGPLDSKILGGSIALSGYGARHGEQIEGAGSKPTVPERGVADCWRAVADALWRQGATLSYAGSWGDDWGGKLMRSLAKDLRRRSVEPSRNRTRREKPDPWFESFVRENGNKSARLQVDAVVDAATRKRCGLRVTIATYLTREENASLASDRWLAQVIEYFRRRLKTSEASVARFVVAGATKAHLGRFPGIAEEVMLALALGKPVYVAGGFGGAALDVGSLLGLGSLRTGEIPVSLKPDPREDTLKTIADKLQPGPWTTLPVTCAELAFFLKEHAIDGSRWPDNGLTVSENRLLFTSEDPEEVAHVVTKGLLRRFGVN